MIFAIKILIKIAVALMGLVAVHVSAISVQINSADWDDVVRGTNLSFVDSDGLTGNEELRWGVPVRSGGESSGYRFDVNDVGLDDLSLGSIFTLGTLTHFNETIKRGGGIKFASLYLGLDVSLLGQDLGRDELGVTLRHRETTNNCTPAPRCADDLVSITEIDASRLFIGESAGYFIDILGFDLGNSLSHLFASPEGGANSVDLVARYGVVQIGEPKSLGLMVFGAIIFFSLRRKIDRQALVYKAEPLS